VTAVVCPVCGHTDGHSKDCPRAVRDQFPAIGDTSTGRGELAGGDVQAVRFSKKRRRPTRHDQKTPLPGDPGWDDYRKGK
jgi:hypothetical protein